MSRRRVRTQQPLTDVDLQAQVTLLTSENERLRALIAQHGLDVELRSNATIPDQEHAAKKTRDSIPPRTSIAAPQTPGTPRTLMKGCSCRGNCSTRVCGCVKKNVSCAEFCRCGDSICQNQDPDKENIGEPNQQKELSKEGEQSLKKMAAMSLNDQDEQKSQVAAQSSNTQVQKVMKQRGLFSPAIDPEQKISASNTTEFANLSLRFGDDTENEESQAVFQSHAESSNKPVKGTKKSSQNKKSRTTKQNLIAPEPQKKLRSLSNGGNEVASNQVKTVRNKRSMSSDGRVDNEAVENRPKITLAALINGTKPPRRGTVKEKASAASNKRESRNHENEINRQLVKENESRQKKATQPENIDKKKGKKRENKNSKPKVQDGNEAMETGEVSNRYDNDDTEVGIPVTEEKTTIPEENTSSEDKKVDDGTETPVVVKIEHEEDDIGEGIEQGDGSINSGSSDAHDDAAGNTSANSEESEDFDPMKPRHKLSRSPIVPRNDSYHYQPHDVSERPLPIPLQEEPALELPPPQELNEPVVDWEKHQAERVHCRKCGRGFYAYRIKKHEASCHKV